MTNKQKINIIKKVFIEGEHYSSNEREELKQFSQEEKDYFKSQRHLKTEHSFAPKGKYGERQQPHSYYQFGDTVMEKLLGSVLQSQNSLNVAKKDANIAFNAYMGYKELLRSGDISYTDSNVRKEFNKLKMNWIKCSQKVQACKKYLSQDKCLLSKFMEFLSLI